MEKCVKISSYSIEFVVCALCGWLFEEGLELLVYHEYADRGALHLPLLPIYGFFGLILAVLFPTKTSIPAVFCISAIITTVLELASSYLLERFGYWLWDYGAWPLNFEGRISLLSSLIFGGMAVLLVKCIHPLMRRMEQEAPKWLVCSLGIVLGAVIAGDAVFTFLVNS